MNTIFDELRNDHDTHRRLLDILAKTEGDSEGREEIFPKLMKELEDHARAEERAFYAALIDDETTQAKATHSIKEHEEMAAALQALNRRDYSDPQWLPTLKSIKETVEHHESEEEQEVFPQAEKVLSQQQQQNLAERFREEKAKETARG